MPLATLSIDLVAQTAKFEAEMRRAAGVVESAAARMDKSFAGVGAVFAGSALASAATEAIKGLLQLFPDLVHGAAHFQDLEEKTGASAEALASFTTAGDVAGVSADQLAGFMVKLTAGLSKTTEETKGVAPALKRLGIDFESFRTLAPEKQFELIAQRLNTFKDGAGKTAVAVALLGKSGADALPFFKELANSGLTQNRLTAEQIKLADDYADRQARVRSELKQTAQIAALSTLPAFTALTAELTKAAREALGMDDAASKLGTNTGVRDFAQGAAIAVATIAEALAGRVKLLRAVGGSFESVSADVQLLAAAGSVLAKPGGVGRLIFDEAGQNELKAALEKRNQIAAEANDRYLKLFTENGAKVSEALRFQFSEAGRIAARIQVDPTELARRGRPVISAADKPVLNFRVPEAVAADKAAREAEQVRKALLDQALKNLESAFQNESEAIQFHERFLEAQYNNGLVSVAGFYADRADIQARALDAQLARFDKEKTALQAFLKDTTDPSKRIETITKIEDLEARAGRARQAFRDKEALDRLAQDREEEQRLNRAREFQAQLLELQGNASGAARLRADAAIDNARRSATGLGLSPEQLRQFDDATRASVAFGDAQRNVQRITEGLSIAEQRVAIEAQASGAGRAEVEQRLFALRSQALQQMGDELARVEAIAAAAGPDSPAVQFARQLRLEFERLAVSVDPALVRMRQVGDEVADALGKAAGAITLNFKDARSAVKSLGDSLTRILSRELVEQRLTEFFRKQIRGITEGAGSGEGLGSILKGAFGFPASTGALTAPGFAGGTLSGAPGAAAPAIAATALASATAAADAALAALGITAIGTDAALSISADSLLELSIAVFEIDASFIALAAAAELAAEALLTTSAAGAGSGVASLFAFDGGGYTGPGATLEPAGLVHKGEVVWSQQDVRRVGGPAQAEAIRLGLRGYAGGGVVSAPRVLRPGAQSAAPGARGSRGGGNTIHQVFNVSVPEGMDKRSEEQLMSKLARTVQNAAARRTNPAH
jgi:hypothetical protein